MDISPAGPSRPARERAPFAPVGPLVSFHLAGPLINNPDFRVTISGRSRLSEPEPWYKLPPVGSAEPPLELETKSALELALSEPPPPAFPETLDPVRPAARKKSPLAKTFPVRREIRSILDIF
jgi:hypothetical protein